MFVVRQPTKVLVRATDQYFINFLKTKNECFLNIRVVLSDQNLDKDNFFMVRPKGMHEDTQLVFWKNSKGF